MQSNCPLRALPWGCSLTIVVCNRSFKNFAEFRCAGILLHACSRDIVWMSCSSKLVCCYHELYKLFTAKKNHYLQKLYSSISYILSITTFRRLVACIRGYATRWLIASCKLADHIIKSCSYMLPLAKAFGFHHFPLIFINVERKAASQS